MGAGKKGATPAGLWEQSSRHVAWFVVGVLIVSSAGAVAFRRFGRYTSAALTQGGGASMIASFRAAETYVNSIRMFGAPKQMFPMTHCPSKAGVGIRSHSEKAPVEKGNICEPWMSRYAIVFLDRLLDPSMRAVEWGSGSSSLWTLMRVGHLTTVEHDDRWAKSVEVAMNDTYGAAYLGQHWDSHVVPRGKPTHSGLLEHFDPDSFKEYSSVEFLDGREGKFDYVVVDGRARAACLPRALELLKPEGGILVLDNANRDRYEQAIAQHMPHHWPKFDDATPSRKEVTSVLVSCRKGACGN